MNQEKIGKFIAKNHKIIKMIKILCFFILFVLFLIKIMIVCGFIGAFSFLTPSEIINDIDKYDKSYYVEKYNGDLDSNLSLFPSSLINYDVSIFESSLKTGLFDTDGYIILQINLNEEQYKAEIKRISSLSMTIKNYDGNSYTNNILFDSSSYNYPAYITADGFANTYEYALLDEDNYNITYIYLSYPNVNNSKYKNYLKKDLKEYNENNTLNRFSMYNHSFDNGQSWIEYDD